MTRPHLTLEEWLSTDTELKKRFLDQETKRRPEQIKKVVRPGQKDCYSYIYQSQVISNNNHVSNLQNQPNPASTHPIFSKSLKFETEQFSLETNDEHFEVLKKRFNTFKYKYTNKNADRVTKQITLNQKTLKELERITDKYNLKSLQNCLDFLLDPQNFKLNQKDKIISELKKELSSNHESDLKNELKLKDEKITQLKNELEHQKNTIHQNMSRSAKEFEEYLIQIAVTKTIELKKFKTYLGDITEADQQSINKILPPEALDQIETELKSEYEIQKRLLVMTNQSYTNEALGFDQHNHSGNTLQNNSEIEANSNIFTLQPHTKQDD